MHPEKGIGVDTLYEKRDHPFLPKIIAHRKSMVQVVFVVCY
jgi:hypothetical protein